MKQNMGTADRVIRSFLALMLGVFMNLGLLPPLWQIATGSFVALLLWTSLSGCCPLYSLIKIKSRTTLSSV